MIVCTKCQKQLENNAKFCEHCGQQININSIEINTIKETILSSNIFLKALKISFGFAMFSALASSIYQSTFFYKIGVVIPSELYGEIFGQFIGYGIIAIPIIYIFLKLKK